jgi:hypothetical protein
MFGTEIILSGGSANNSYNNRIRELKIASRMNVEYENKDELYKSVQDFMYTLFGENNDDRTIIHTGGLKNTYDFLIDNLRVEFKYNKKNLYDITQIVSFSLHYNNDLFTLKFPDFYKEYTGIQNIEGLHYYKTDNDEINVIPKSVLKAMMKSYVQNIGIHYDELQHELDIQKGKIMMLFYKDKFICERLNDEMLTLTGTCKKVINNRIYLETEDENYLIKIDCRFKNKTTYPAAVISFSRPK